ncbi:hypothetical protein [Akkermansia sp.]|uniref:hypothetical protein n=1 Tax=Akkermansia sp. TaxID=1872421 RepID=UPI0025BFEFB4|nr:hypothetical protein [Akkermansia sp.]MCC8149136.1 hypothetical protein [Akkermansia sp.]
MYYKIIRNIFVSFFVVWCSSCFIAFSQAGESGELSRPRVWTAATGHKLTAVYAGRDGNNIRLKIQNGQIRTILLEKLSEADQQLLNNQMQEESGDGNVAVSNTGKGGRNHPYITFLTEAKQKRLSPEDGVKYYQNVINALYQHLDSYKFRYPKDFIKEDGFFNMKYLKSVHIKKKRISERKNLFTEENLPTLIYSNEPRWEMVEQKVKFILDGDLIQLKQQDILYAGSKEKIEEFGISINKKKRNAESYDAWYKEDGKDYLYQLETCVNPSDDGEFAVIRTKGMKWLTLCSQDLRKGILYTLKVLIDENGKIAIRNSEEGSFMFYATLPNKKAFVYPRADDRLVFTSVYVKAIALGRYDMNGFPVDLEKLWAGVEQRNYYVDAKPSDKHGDPLNVFAERNIKDK